MHSLVCQKPSSPLLPPRPANRRRTVSPSSNSSESSLFWAAISRAILSILTTAKEAILNESFNTQIELEHITIRMGKVNSSLGNGFKDVDSKLHECFPRNTFIKCFRRQSKQSQGPVCRLNSFPEISDWQQRDPHFIFLI